MPGSEKAIATASTVMAPCEKICRSPVQRLCVGVPRCIAISVGSPVPFLLAPAGARYDGIQRADRRVLERPAETDRHARFGQGLVVTIEVRERLREIIVRGGRPRMDHSGPPEGLLGRCEVTGTIGGISRAHERHDLVRPALERALVGSPSRREWTGLFKARHGA